MLLLLARAAGWTRPWVTAIRRRAAVGLAVPAAVEAVGGLGVCLQRPLQAARHVPAIRRRPQPSPAQPLDQENELLALARLPRVQLPPTSSTALMECCARPPRSRSSASPPTPLGADALGIALALAWLALPLDAVWVRGQGRSVQGSGSAPESPLAAVPIFYVRLLAGPETIATRALLLPRVPLPHVVGKLLGRDYTLHAADFEGRTQSGPSASRMPWALARAYGTSQSCSAGLMGGASAARYPS